MKTAELIDIFLQCSADDKMLANGGRFVGRLGGAGSYRYLHQLYSGLADEELDNIAELFGFDLPQDYKEFLRRCGGCDLYAHSIYIFGYDENRARSLDPEAFRAVGVVSELKDYKLVHPNEFIDGWRPIGVCGFNQRAYLCINGAGTGRLISSSSSTTFPSFMDMLGYLTTCLRSIAGCDRPDEGLWPALEGLMFGHQTEH